MTHQVWMAHTAIYCIGMHPSHSTSSCNNALEPMLGNKKKPTTTTTTTIKDDSWICFFFFSTLHHKTVLESRQERMTLLIQVFYCNRIESKTCVETKHLRCTHTWKVTRAVLWVSSYNGLKSTSSPSVRRTAGDSWWTCSSQPAAPVELLGGLTGQVPGVNVCTVTTWVWQGVAERACPVSFSQEGWSQRTLLRVREEKLRNVHNPWHTSLPEFRGQLFYPSLLSWRQS